MTSATMNEVLVDVSEGVATITINRPDARNALNAAVRRALPAAARAVEADDAVDVMILTGADPAFSAGIDLKEVGAGHVPGEELRSRREQPAAKPHERGRGLLPPRTKLLIGAVNGVAVTGGLEVALGCDFLVASERARFADTHAATTPGRWRTACRASGRARASTRPRSSAAAPGSWLGDGTRRADLRPAGAW